MITGLPYTDLYRLPGTSASSSVPAPHRSPLWTLSGSSPALPNRISPHSSNFTACVCLHGGTNRVGGHWTPTSLSCANIFHCFKTTRPFPKVNIRVSPSSGIIILSWLECLWILNLSTKVLVLQEVTQSTTASGSISPIKFKDFQEKLWGGGELTQRSPGQRALRSSREHGKDPQSRSQLKPFMEVCSQLLGYSVKAVLPCHEITSASSKAKN